ncbi:MAG: LysE family translocator [Maritimibacter sp.]
MTFETWLIFALAYLLVTLSPGPNVLLVASHAVKYGYRSIAITISANLLCQMGIVMGVALGVGALMTVDSLAFKLIKYSGASYLVFLGAKMIYTALSEKGGLVRAIEACAKTRPGIAKRFREAFFVSDHSPDRDEHSCHLCRAGGVPETADRQPPAAQRNLRCDRRPLRVSRRRAVHQLGSALRRQG